MILSLTPALFSEGIGKDGNMKTMVAIPCMETIQTETVASLLRMKQVGDVRFELLPCSLVYKSRTDLALLALAGKTDYVLWVDSDMVFPDSLMVDLMADMEGRDIVAGVCHMRRPPYRPVFYKTLRQGLTPDQNVSEHYDDYPTDGLFKVEGVGFGLVMMRTGVIQAVVDKYHDLFAPLRGYGEDLSFCIRARGCGYDIWVDPKLQIGHKASTIVTNKTFEAYRDAGTAHD